MGNKWNLAGAVLHQGVWQGDVNGVLRRFTKGGDGVAYYNNTGYRNVYEYQARRWAYQQGKNLLNKLFADKSAIARRQSEELFRMQQDAVYAQIIKEGKRVDAGYGELLLEGGTTIKAQDKYGNFVPEALILSYEGDVSLKGSIDIVSSGNLASARNGNGSVTLAQTHSTVYTTKTVFFIDLAPSISVSSAKNVILTPVQGRDFTRKELVSGGDLSFSVSGSIASHYNGVYPEAEVARFIQLMQYGGILNVNHLLFGQLNVTRVIIKDFSLEAQEYKNIQPYSFSCVAIEPDEEVRVQQDTVSTLNYRLQASNLSGVHKPLLERKAQEIAKNGIEAVAGQAFMSLDDLIGGVL